MVRARPRRALKAPIGVRVVRVAVPAVAAGALIIPFAVNTVADFAWSSSSLQAIPAGSSANVTVAPSAAPSGAVVIGSELVSAAQVERATQGERANRGSTRGTLTAPVEKVPVEKVAAEEAAVEKAVVLAAVQQKVAKKRAAAEKRAAVKEKAEKLKRSIIGSRYATADVKLRTKPAKDAKSVDTIESAKKLKVTDTVEKGFRQVVVDGKARWVTNEYLSKKKPSAEEAAGISDASCSKSSGVESGLVSNARSVYRAICAAFPEVSSFGGRRGGDGGFHGTGQAVDAMISDSAAGRRLANWLRAHAADLGISEVIYSQQIWTAQRSGEGWRGMSDRGSATANHYDHVHVSVY